MYSVNNIVKSINVCHPTSEYLTIREYYDVCAIVSQISRYLYEYVKNVFNVIASVLIDSKLYTHKIRVYNI